MCENEWDKLDGTNEDKLLSEITLGIEAIKAEFGRISLILLHLKINWNSVHNPT